MANAGNTKNSRIGERRLIEDLLLYLSIGGAEGRIGDFDDIERTQSSWWLFR